MAPSWDDGAIVALFVFCVFFIFTDFVLSHLYKKALGRLGSVTLKLFTAIDL